MGCCAPCTPPPTPEPTPTPPECPPLELRTQTQGSWGSTPRGNNPGTYLHANFDSCIGLLQVGKTGCNTALFHTAQAITNYLPDGGSPAAFTTDHVNPLSTESGVFGSQLTTAMLNVAFDDCDPDFGASDVALATLVYQDGPCVGQTVENVILEANRVIGACPLQGDKSPSQLSDCLATLNENYDDGEGDEGHFCPP